MHDEPDYTMSDDFYGNGLWDAPAITDPHTLAAITPHPDDDEETPLNETEAAELSLVMFALTYPGKYLAGNPTEKEKAIIAKHWRPTPKPR